MRDIDRAAIDEHKIPSQTLMENAGKQVSALLKSRLDDLNHKVIYVFCGKGNNGGDGFVASRYLARMNARVFVFLLGKSEDVSGDARRNLELAKQMRIPVEELIEDEQLDFMESHTSPGNERWTFHRPEPDAVVDALLGTGAKGKVTGAIKKVIDIINQLQKPVAAVDVPSGLNADTGEASESCVKAAWTVTMGLPKTGFFLSDGMDTSGEVIIADIGFPEPLLKSGPQDMELLTKDFTKTLLPAPRKANTHKGDYGRVLIIAGSPGMTGAACLCAESCLRSGAGLVTVAVPESLNPVLETKLTEVMTLPVAETSQKTLSSSALEALLSFSRRCDAVAIGPGISTHWDTRKLVYELAENLKVPFVLDADGLNCLADDEHFPALLRKQSPCILTPHPGEMSRLLKTQTKEINKNRIRSVKQTAQKAKCTVVLKGAYTLISDESQKTYVNPTGNPGMATGGTGDVLTGMIAGFLAQGMAPLHASLLSVYLHGLAGDLARDKTGEISLTASDMLSALPEAIKNCRN